MSDKRGWAVIFGQMSDETMQVARQYRALAAAQAADNDSGTATPRSTPEPSSAAARRSGGA